MKKRYIALIIVIALFILFALRIVLGAISINFFLFFDRLANITNSLPPVVAWCILGLLIGAVYGAILAKRTYNLAPKITYISVGILAGIIAILYFVNNPLKAAVNLSQLKNVYGYALIDVKTADSNTLQSANGNSILNVQDKDYTNAWISERATGCEISFVFPADKFIGNASAQCTGFGLMNGYDKNIIKYKQYSRIKEFSVYHNNQKTADLVAADYFYNMQYIRVTPFDVAAGDSITIRINSVYPGSQYSAHTAIAELVPVIQYVTN